MRDQELRDQIAALFRCAPGEQRLGDEPPGPIADAVLEVVGPLLAEKDAEARSLAKSWDQRLSDVQAEYVKHLESWDRQRGRLERTVEDLRGKIRLLCDDLDEAVGMVKICTGHPDTGQPSHFDLIQKAEGSRRDWATEALRLDQAYEETVKSLVEEIAWQKHAYRDGTDKVATGRTIGMEDALRTLTETFASRPVCAVHLEEQP